MLLGAHADIDGIGRLSLASSWPLIIAPNLTSHFQKGELYWIACCVAAIVVNFVLRETGRAGHPLPAPQ